MHFAPLGFDLETLHDYTFLQENGWNDVRKPCAIKRHLIISEMKREEEKPATQDETATNRDELMALALEEESLSLKQEETRRHSLDTGQGNHIFNLDIMFLW